MFSHLHVCDARRLDILAELRVRQRQIGPGHRDKVANISYATVAMVEVWFGVGVAIVF